MKNQPSLVERVREIVERNGLVPAKVSREMGRNPTYIRDLMSGKVRSPKSEHLPALAAALGVTLRELLGPDYPKSPFKEFRELGHATPWWPSEHAKGTNTPDINSILQTLYPTSQHPSVLRAEIFVPSFGFMPGDLIVVDLKRRPKRGELVVINRSYEDIDTAATLFRRWLDPFLVPPETGIFVEPELGNENEIVGPIIGVIRAPEMSAF